MPDLQDFIDHSPEPEPERRAIAPELNGAIPEGERDNTLTSLAGTMRRKSMETEEIEVALLAVNARRCRPPLPDAQVSKIARSVGRYTPAPVQVKPSAELQAPTSWRPTDMAAVLAGELVDDVPTILQRADGARLLYAGRVNAIIGETESGKTWLALEAVRQELGAGKRVVFLDFEDTAGRIASRLLTLGVPVEEISSRLAYVSPAERLSERAWRDLSAAAEGASLVVVDGVTEAMAREGLELADNTDVQNFYDLLPRPLAQLGACVVLLDHVPKDREGRGRYALGGQHKLAGIDGAAYTLETRLPFGRGRDGIVGLKISKDRAGAVRGLDDGGNGAIKVHAGELVEVEILPAAGGGEAFRPTHLMERVSRLLEDAPAMSKNAIETSVAGKAKAVRLAIERLIVEDYVRVEKGPHGAILHASIKPFREAQK